MIEQPNEKIEAFILAGMERMTDDERHRIIYAIERAYCRFCGGKQSRDNMCQCDNDE